MQIATSLRCRRRRTDRHVRLKPRGFVPVCLPTLPSDAEFLKGLFFARLAHKAVGDTKHELRDKVRGLLAEGDRFEAIVEEMSRVRELLSAIVEITDSARARMLVVAGEILNAEATEAPI